MVGPDDPDELVQDGLAIAIGLLQSAQRAGKKVTASNLAYYAILALRSGRRSTGVHRNDVLHPKSTLKPRSVTRTLGSSRCRAAPAFSTGSGTWG